MSPKPRTQDQLLLDLGTNPEFLLELLDQPVSFNRVLKPLAGSTDAALLLSGLIGQTEIIQPSDGWIIVDRNFLHQETALSAAEQQRAERQLCKRRLIEGRSGVAGFEVRLNMHEIANRLSHHAESLRLSARNKPKSH